MARKPNPYIFDEENPELTDEELASARPASEVLPPELCAKLISGKVEIVPDPVPAETVEVRLSLDRRVVDAFKAQAPGWQRRIDDTLKKAVGL